MLHAAFTDTASPGSEARTGHGNVAERVICPALYDIRGVICRPLTSGEGQPLITLRRLPQVRHDVRELLRLNPHGITNGRDGRWRVIAALVPGNHLLCIRHEEKGKVLAVNEHAKSAANYGVVAGRIGNSDSRLPVVVVVHNEL